MSTTTILSIFIISLLVTTITAVSDQQQLLDLVNQYRNENGLPSVPTSYWLTATAMLHTIDRRDNGLPEEYGCVSGHSWSGRSPLFSGPCCYSGAEWECMCLKPTEISNGKFNGVAYENWVRAPNAEVAVNAWKGSPSHNDLMLNLNGWAGSTWKSMGAFTCEYYYALWFSETEDPDSGADIDILTCKMDTNAPVPVPGVGAPSALPSVAPSTSERPSTPTVPTLSQSPNLSVNPIIVESTSSSTSSSLTPTISTSLSQSVSETASLSASSSSSQSPSPSISFSSSSSSSPSFSQSVSASSSISLTPTSSSSCSPSMSSHH